MWEIIVYLKDPADYDLMSSFYDIKQIHNDLLYIRKDYPNRKIIIKNKSLNIIKYCSSYKDARIFFERMINILVFH